MRFKGTGFAMFAIMLTTAQPAAALNVQLQLQLPTDGKGEQVNDAFLSIAAASFLAIKHFNNRESPVISLGDNCDALSQISVEIIDTHGSEVVALNGLLTKTPESRPDIIIGPIFSKEVIPLALTASTLNVPIIAYAATSQELDDNEKYKTFLRTIPSDKTVAEAICKLFSFYKYAYISVIYADEAYGSAYKDAVAEACRDMNIRTRAVSFKVSSPESVQNAVGDLRSFESNIVVIVAYGEDIKTAVRQALEIGMIGPGKLWVFSDAADSATLQNMATEPDLAQALDGNLRMFAAGTIEGHGQFTEFSSYWNTIGDGRLSTGAEDLAYINDMLNTSGSDDELDSSFFAGPESISAFAAFAYDAMIAAGIAECEAGNGGPTDLLAALLNRSPPIEGVSGTIKFGENGSRDPNSAYFVVENLRWDGSSLTFPAVGSLNATTGTLIENTPVMFADFTNTPPHDRAVVVTNYNYISDLVFYGALAMVAILFLLTFLMLIWVVSHRNSRVVQHSQGIFLITLLCGTMLSSATIIPLVLDDHRVSDEVADMACMASPWVYSLGFVITFSALFAKTYRVAKIFNNKSLQRIQVRTRDLLGAVGVLAFTDCSLLTAWQLSSPLRWQRGSTSVDSFGRELDSLGVCTDIPLGMTSVEGGIDSSTFLAILACLHVGLLVYGVYLSYTARNLPTTFQESKWIGLAMASMLQLFMMGVPVVFAVADDPTARGLVMTSVIFLHNMVLIGAVMFPKLHAFYFLGDGENMTGVDVGSIVVPRGKDKDLSDHIDDFVISRANLQEFGGRQLVTADSGL